MNIPQLLECVAKILKSLNQQLQENSTGDIKLPLIKGGNKSLCKHIVKIIKQEFELIKVDFSIELSKESFKIKYNPTQCQRVIEKSSELQIEFTQQFNQTFSFSWTQTTNGYLLSMPNRPWLIDLFKLFSKKCRGINQFQSYTDFIYFNIYFEVEKVLFYEVMWATGLTIKPFPVNLAKELCTYSQNKNIQELNLLDESVFYEKLEELSLIPDYEDIQLKRILAYRLFSTIANQTFTFDAIEFPQPQGRKILEGYDFFVEKAPLCGSQTITSLFLILGKDIMSLKITDLQKLTKVMADFNRVLKNEDEKYSSIQQLQLNIYKSNLVSAIFNLTKAPILKDRAAINEFYLIIDNLLKICRTTDAAKKRQRFMQVPYEKIEIGVLIKASNWAMQNNDFPRLAYFCDRAIKFKKTYKQGFAFNEQWLFRFIEFNSFHLQDNTHYMMLKWLEIKTELAKFKRLFNTSGVQKDFVSRMAMFYQFTEQYLLSTFHLSEQLLAINRPQEAYTYCTEALEDCSPQAFRNFAVNFKPTKSKNLIIEKHKDINTHIFFNEKSDANSERMKLIEYVASGNTNAIKKLKLSKLDAACAAIKALTPRLTLAIIDKQFKKIQSQYCAQFGFKITKSDSGTSLILYANEALINYCSKNLKKYKCEQQSTTESITITGPKTPSIQQLYAAMRNAHQAVLKASQEKIAKDVKPKLSAPNSKPERSLIDLLYGFGSRQATKRVPQSNRGKGNKKHHKGKKQIVIATPIKRTDIKVDFGDGLSYDSTSKQICKVVALYNDSHYKFGTYFAYLDPEQIPEEYFKLCDKTLRNRGDNAGLIVPPHGCKGTKFFKKSGLMAYKIKIMKNVFAVGTITQNVIYDCNGIPKKAFLIHFDRISDHGKEKRKLHTQVENKQLTDENNNNFVM